MSDSSFQDDAVEVGEGDSEKEGLGDENGNLMEVKLTDEVEVESETVDKVENFENVEKSNNQEEEEEKKDDDVVELESEKESDQETEEKVGKKEKRGRKKLNYPGWIEVEGGKMQCDKCQGVKGPVDRKNIGQHMRVYHQEAKFKCEICGKV